ncbi:hypothetical protein Pelo_1915 [Pelomyxa schiedti]|nr:hypothetical protein Pelo_1915 [Pelomyxa schiedti]
MDLRDTYCEICCQPTSCCTCGAQGDRITEREIDVMVERYSLAQLKESCRTKNVKVSGNKRDLALRILEQGRLQQKARQQFQQIQAQFSSSIKSENSMASMTDNAQAPPQSPSKRRRTHIPLNQAESQQALQAVNPVQTHWPQCTLNPETSEPLRAQKSLFALSNVDVESPGPFKPDEEQSAPVESPRLFLRNPVGSTTALPPRKFHTSVVHCGKMFVFGGVEIGVKQHFSAASIDSAPTTGNLSQLFSSSYLKSLSPSSSPQKGTPVPSSRRTPTISPNACVASVIAYDFTTNTWSSVECNGQLPPPRSKHSAVLLDGIMYIFGGKAGDKSALNDVYALNLNGPPYTWSLLHPGDRHQQTDTFMDDDGVEKPESQVPLARYKHSMFICQGSMFIFGGASPAHLSCKDASLWWCGNSTKQSPIIHGDMWEFHIARSTWSQVQPSTSPSPVHQLMSPLPLSPNIELHTKSNAVSIWPQERYAHACAGSSGESRWVICGGIGRDLVHLSDVWEFDCYYRIWRLLASPTSGNPSSSTPPVMPHAVACVCAPPTAFPSPSSASSTSTSSSFSSPSPTAPAPPLSPFSPTANINITECTATTPPPTPTTNTNTSTNTSYVATSPSAPEQHAAGDVIVINDYNQRSSHTAYHLDKARTGDWSTEVPDIYWGCARHLCLRGASAVAYEGTVWIWGQWWGQVTSPPLIGLRVWC